MAFTLVSALLPQHLPPVTVPGTKGTTLQRPSHWKGRLRGWPGGPAAVGFLLGTGGQHLLPQERHAGAVQCTLVTK